MDDLFDDKTNFPQSDLKLRLFGRKVFVAFVDILGFKSAMEYDRINNVNHQSTIYSLWRNTVLPQKEKLYSNYDKFLNFAQFSDCIVFYGTDPKELTNLVCDFYGWNFSWGVPIRGGLGYGQLYHSDSFSGLGATIMINGQGLVDAHMTEQDGKGLGMRLLVSDSFRDQTKDLDLPFQPVADDRIEYPWWLASGHDQNYFLSRSKDWWTTKHVGKWFNGSHREDTEKVFQAAITSVK